MEQLKLYAFTDEKFSQKNHAEPLSLAVNPQSLRFGKSIVYNENRQLGTTGGTNTFDRYKPETLEFSFGIDCTGIVEGTAKDDNARVKIDELEKYLYLYNSEGHRPSYVMIAYGEVLFKGQLTSMHENYTTFTVHGIPLCAQVDLAFVGFRCNEEERKRYSKQSPDVSRVIMLKESDTLAALCEQIYGNSLLVTEVARFNNLNGFRDIPAGTEILFPPVSNK
jgi:hypothetical protein